MRTTLRDQMQHSLYRPTYIDRFTIFINEELKRNCVKQLFVCAAKQEQEVQLLLGWPTQINLIGCQQVIELN